MNNPTLVDAAEDISSHSKKLNIMGQKMARRRKKQRKPAAQHQHQPDKHQQRTSIAHQSGEIAASIDGIHDGIIAFSVKQNSKTSVVRSFGV
jgi:hypothetical protein